MPVTVSHSTLNARFDLEEVTMAKYPTWAKLNASLVYSQEQRDGTPDFIIERAGHRDRPGKFWWVKWRTSAHWSGPYDTLDAAKESVAEGGVK
jgi:hypothetical protein